MAIEQIFHTLFGFSFFLMVFFLVGEVGGDWEMIKWREIREFLMLLKLYLSPSKTGGSSHLRRRAFVLGLT